MAKQKPKQLTLTASDLPPAVRVFWDTAPEQFKVPAILTAIDCYCALGTRLRAMYVYDPLEPHALLIQLLVLGEPGSGKSFTRPIVKQLMRPLKLKDLEQKRIEQAYADLKKTASKNKQLPEEPITCTRNLQTITRAKLVKRADMFIRKYGEPLAFFFFNEELATMTESNKRAFADLNTMDRLAYDLGSEFGSDTLSDASYNADVDIIYCSLFCGTDNALSEYINKRAVEGGNCTRKVLTRIDEDVLGEDAPMFRQQSNEERAIVQATINQLMAETTPRMISCSLPTLWIWSGSTMPYALGVETSAGLSSRPARVLTTASTSVPAFRLGEWRHCSITCGARQKLLAERSSSSIAIWLSTSSKVCSRNGAVSTIRCTSTIPMRITRRSAFTIRCLTSLREICSTRRVPNKVCVPVVRSSRNGARLSSFISPTLIRMCLSKITKHYG